LRIQGYSKKDAKSHPKHIKNVTSPPQQQNQVDAITTYTAAPATPINQAANAVSDVDVISASEWDAFIDNLENLSSQTEKLNSTIQWAELLNSPIMLDLQYRKQASDRIFCLLADNHLADSSEQECTITPATLRYLNNEFRWEENRFDVESRLGSTRCDAVFGNMHEELSEKVIRRLATAGALISLTLVFCGYFGVSILVVLVAAVPIALNRIYVRQWQKKAYGTTPGGDAAFLQDNKAIYFAFMYVVGCIVAASFYGIGRLIHWWVS